MESTYPLEAIVLDRTYHREYDSRISIFSRERGRQELVVRGTRRPKSKLAGHIEPMSLVDLLVVKGKQYDYAGSAVGRDSFTGIKNDLDRIRQGARIIRFFRRVVERDEPDARLYDLLHSSLRELDRSGDSAAGQETQGLAFVLRFLSLSGYRPQLERCIGCDCGLESRAAYFAYADGGLVCVDCGKGKKEKLVISPENISFMHRVLSMDAPSMPEALKIQELKHVLDIYVRYCFACEY